VTSHVHLLHHNKAEYYSGIIYLNYATWCECACLASLKKMWLLVKWITR